MNADVLCAVICRTYGDRRVELVESKRQKLQYLIPGSVLHFADVFRKIWFLQGPFKDASRTLQGRLKDASRMLQGCFMALSRALQGHFNDSSRPL